MRPVMIAIELFEVPPGGEDEFLVAWSEEGEGTLYRALRDDVPFRFAELGPGAEYVMVHGDGAPDADAGTTLIAPFHVPRGEDAAFVAAWGRSHAVLAEQRGFIGGRLYRGEGDFRFIEIARWSSPLMVQRATHRPDYEPPPFTAYPALYVVAAAGASSG